jgi:hypothetical protein
VEHEWWTGEWELARIDNAPFPHYSITQRWSKERLYIDTRDGDRLSIGYVPELPAETGYWVFEPVDDAPGLYRIRNLYLHDRYLNTENQLDETADARVYNVQTSAHDSGWVSALWRLCVSQPPP